MISFQNKKVFRLGELSELEQTVSTLLVPAHLVVALKQKTREPGKSLVAYFRNLLRMYRTFTHTGMILPPRKIKTEYQEEGLDLKRVSFRVGNEDWLELGELAIAFGKSRCWMFTYLLELDLLGVWNILSEFGLEDAVPTSASLRLRVSLTFRRVLQDFARSYHVRV